MNSAQIRQKFLEYFASKGHEVVRSSSLVPGNDPTLMFTNAGMVQFKDVFLGDEQRNYSRATSSQRCVRAGGKHNDLENVGYTARHHTFFEMLGNFSFGDYFKRDAIFYAWEFLTKELGLPAERLWVTVHHTDQEAEDIWLNDVGVSAERFSRLGDKDNFWMMGDTGPCGPSSEIFYDHGEAIAGGPPGSENDDLDRYIEIWNLVFMQYQQHADGSRTLLPKPSVDTGMGLERVSAIMQGVHTNYDIDVFQALINAAAVETGTSQLDHKSLRVIADHIRSCAFLLADGVMPSADGRGYVLRRIIRRAIRHGYLLGCEKTFFYKLVPALIEQMGQAYPELVEQRAQIEKILRLEEESFRRTLSHGIKLLDEAVEKLEGDVISGEVIFTLYDTHGFPVDLTADIAREKDLRLDMDGYEAEMQAQRMRAKEASKFSMAGKLDINVAQTKFIGYESLVADATVLAIYQSGQSVASIEQGEAIVVFDVTSAYAESGGQMGDHGLVSSDHCEFEFTDCQKQGAFHLHVGSIVAGVLSVGDKVQVKVDPLARQGTAIHHSATHLLHAALRRILGDHVQQKGSMVTGDRLRFDFSHFESIKADELSMIERLVNQQIRANTEIQTELLPIDVAKARGAMALFGEKYDDEVRVLSMGTDNFSVELCGGTHARRTGDIGYLRVLSEGSVSAGVRRLEAVCGESAIESALQDQALIVQAEATLKAKPGQLLDKVGQVQDRVKQLEKELAALQSKVASSAGSDMASQAVEVAGVKVLVSRVDDVDAKGLRELIDQLRNKLGQCVVLLISELDGKVQVAAGVEKSLISKVKAGELVNIAAQIMDGRGGGKPDMAMAGAKNPGKIPEALSAASAWVKEKLG